MEFQDLVVKETLEVVFSIKEYDLEFIDNAIELNLAEYFTELDLNDCDLQEAYYNTCLVCKHIPVLSQLMDSLPKKFSKFYITWE